MREQQPVVSIIINNYNYGRFLARAIDSALGQEDCPVEVIVVDDGSTDLSRVVIAGYGDRILPILKPNGGQASALNAGFAACHGDVVIFLDADDVLLPHAARKMSAPFAARRNLSKVQCRMAYIDAAGARIGIKPSGHQPMPGGDLRRQALAFPDDLHWMPTSGNAFAARVLHRIFPIPQEPFRILADFYLCHTAALFGPLLSIDDVCACYRVHGHNNHERARPAIDLPWIRQAITHWDRTHASMKAFADELNLSGRPESPRDILSVTFVANRLISLRLDPAHHPIAGDSVAQLFRLGVKAAGRRFDVPLPMRLVFVAWFAAMALAPQVYVRLLAMKFLFPATRARLNPLLALLQRPRVSQEARR
jgi:glycosyltransferase involved in cell wall biosynthesis